MELSGASRTPEFDLTASSVQNANAKLNFFRVTFGPATDTELSQSEINRILTDIYSNARCQVSWQVTNAIPRQEAKLLFLLIQCLESALPRGGDITVFQNALNTTLIAQGTKINCDGPNWDLLLGKQFNPDLNASDVHFELARIESAVAERSITLDCEDHQVIITL
jgi:histidine phosphotransferase ChpT